MIASGHRFRAETQAERCARYVAERQQRHGKGDRAPPIRRPQWPRGTAHAGAGRYSQGPRIIIPIGPPLLSRQAQRRPYTKHDLWPISASNELTPRQHRFVDEYFLDLKRGRVRNR